MQLNIAGQLIGWNIIFITTKRIFNFFGNDLQACQYIKNKGYYRDHIVPQLENITKGQGHDIKENEFFQEHAIGKGNGGILDPFAGSADISEG